MTRIGDLTAALVELLAALDAGAPGPIASSSAKARNLLKDVPQRPDSGSSGTNLNACKAAFAAAYPKAVDFPESVYNDLQPELSNVAAVFGYRLAGVRMGVAVYATKAAPTPQEEIA